MQRARVIVCALVVLAVCISASVASAAEVKELQLAGIRLGRSALTIIKMYGNPTEIRIGGRGAQEETAQTGGPFLGLPMEGPPPGMSGGSPAFPGLEAPPPMAFGSPVTPTGPSTSPFGQVQSGRKPSGPEVTWIYKFAKNRTLEFIINPDGYVIQVAAFGVQWPEIKTSRGISLGGRPSSLYKRTVTYKGGKRVSAGTWTAASDVNQSTYKDVILTYGYPESQQRTGAQIVMKYTERNRVAFTLLGTTVVGITVGFWD